MPTYIKPTDTAHKIQVESHLIYALWMFKRAHAVIICASPDSLGAIKEKPDYFSRGAKYCHR